MIYLRDDDVLVPSKSYDDPFKRFRQLHEWALHSKKLMHVPTLIISQLEEFPECVEYIRAETLAGRMQPELHGMFHVDYAKLSPQHVREHLAESIEWMEQHVGRSPEIWYTPWGQYTPDLILAAQQYGLQLRGVDREWALGKVTGRLREGRLTLADLEERDLFFHWWAGGCRVLRVAKALEAGSWEAAALADPELFGD